MLKKSLVTKRCTGFLCFVEKQLQPSPFGPPFFKVITDTSSNAESRKEQNGPNQFLIGATTAKYGCFSKGMQAKRKK